MTTTDRAELRELADAATPGPWEVSGSLVGTGRAKPDIGQTWGVRWRQDIEFIAASREAVPALLDALTRAEAQSETRRQQTAYWQERAEGFEARIQAVRDALAHHPYGGPDQEDAIRRALDAP